jgi:hypothetical protein
VVDVRDRLNPIVCSIYPQAVFTPEFLLRVKYLVLVKLDVANDDDLAVLWNPNSVNIAALIAHQIANIRPGLRFIGCSVLITFQNLLPNGIDFTPVGLDVCGV